jgi:hypothetical protein
MGTGCLGCPPMLICCWSGAFRFIFCRCFNSVLWFRNGIFQGISGIPVSGMSQHLSAFTFPATIFPCTLLPLPPLWIKSCCAVWLHHSTMMRMPWLHVDVWCICWSDSVCDRFVWPKADNYEACASPGIWGQAAAAQECQLVIWFQVNDVALLLVITMTHFEHEAA